MSGPDIMGTVYTSAKLWHFPEQLAALRDGGLAPPVHIRLKPTNVCNHACYFCAYRTDNVALGDHTVFVAEVVDAGHRRQDEPLEMWPTNWFYGG